MKHEKLDEFIRRKAKKDDLCYYYSSYTQEQKEALENIYNACWRINILESQTIYMLNELLRAFSKDWWLDL